MILGEADTQPFPEVPKKDKVNPQAIYGERKHFGALALADLTQPR